MDEFWEMAQKDRLYDNRSSGIRWRFPHRCAHWFGMTRSDDASNSQFVSVLTKDMVWESLDSEAVSIAMRPYIILEDENGDTVTIYGGIVYRSIGYIAYQNRKAFTPGSAAYEYVWNIIHYVYGKQYDADYKK